MSKVASRESRKFYLEGILRKLRSSPSNDGGRESLSITAKVVQDYMESRLGEKFPIEGPHSCLRCHHSGLCPLNPIGSPDANCMDYLPVRPMPSEHRDNLSRIKIMQISQAGGFGGGQD